MKKNNWIIDGVSELHGRYEGFNPCKKTPRTYQEAIDCALPGFEKDFPIDGEQELKRAAKSYRDKKKAVRDRNELFQQKLDKLRRRANNSSVKLTPAEVELRLDCGLNQGCTNPEILEKFKDNVIKHL